MAIREGRWDCHTCGRTGNRGPEKHCAGCGHPRGPGVEFYLPANAPELTDAESLERARAGPDWNCEHCGGDNRADAAFCTGCGAPRGGSQEREVVEHRTPVSASGARPEPHQAAPPRPSGPPSKERRKELRDRHRRKKKGGCRRTLLVGLLVLVALVALISWCGRTDETVATVTGFGWERAVQIERLEAVTAEAPANRVPADARILDTRGEQGKTRTVTERVKVGTERVKVGVRDLGNGFFEDIYEDRPVYELRRREVPVRGPPGGMVRYEIERWRPAREAKASGSDRSPRWPRVALATGERQGERTERLTVSFTDGDGRRLRYSARSEGEWRRFAVGQRYRVEATSGGAIRSLSPR